MKGGTVQINWHGSDPVLSLDFHRSSALLATGGADHDIKFWTLHQSDEAPLPSVSFHSCLSYHTAAVNVVRFSPTGEQLASGADGGEILLWKLIEDQDASSSWKLSKNLRLHVKDVLDLQWSTEGTLLASASVDNTVIIWDISKGNPQQVLKDHMHYVQGIAWDPIGQYFASISNDRTCRIYCNKPQNQKRKSEEQYVFTCQNVLVKAELVKQEEETCPKVPAAKHHLFHDETLPSFFRRLAWSPDGSFLLVPSGIHKSHSDSTLTNTAFVVSRTDFSRPAMHLPGASKPIVAVRFCPVVFSLNPNMNQNFDNGSNSTSNFKLPYRFVFAVATLNSLYVYDTQSNYPLAILAGIHYAAITDIAWSWDAKFLVVSSQDGFCTLVSFDNEELGCPMPSNELPSYVAKFLPIAKDSVVDLQIKSSSQTTTSIQGKEVQPDQMKKVDVLSEENVEHEAKNEGKDETETTHHVSVKNTDLGSGSPKETAQGEAGVMNIESCKKHLNDANIQAESLLGHTSVVKDNSSSLLQSTDISVDIKNEKVSDDVEKAIPPKPRRITPIAITTNSAQSS